MVPCRHPRAAHVPHRETLFQEASGPPRFWVTQNQKGRPVHTGKFCEGYERGPVSAVKMKKIEI